MHFAESSETGAHKVSPCLDGVKNYFTVKLHFSTSFSVP